MNTRSPSYVSSLDWLAQQGINKILILLLPLAYDVENCFSPKVLLVYVYLILYELSNSLMNSLIPRSRI